MTLETVTVCYDAVHTAFTSKAGVEVFIKLEQQRINELLHFGGGV